MTVGEIRQRIMPMLEDTNWAERAMQAEDSPFTRRAYVRSVFAMIEGTLWVLKQTVLEAAALPGSVKGLSVAEHALLSEITYELRNNGHPREQPKFLRLPANLRFTFGVIAKYFDPDLDLGVGTPAWENFLASHGVRNRITHPKLPKDFEISNTEIATVKQTTAWFYRLVLKVFDSFTPPAS